MNRWFFFVVVFWVGGSEPFLYTQSGMPELGDDSPHFNGSRCGDCHGRDRPEDAAAYGGRKNLYTHLCSTCHPSLTPVCRYHMDRKPSPKNGEAVPYTQYPLNKGKFYCLTCHDARIQCASREDKAARDNPLFLRGEYKGGIPWFCFNCHGTEGFQAFNVHRSTKKKVKVEDDRCIYCHRVNRRDSKKEKDFPLRSHTNATCLVCHRVRNHPEGIDHLVSLERMGESSRCLLVIKERRSWIWVQEGVSSSNLPLGEDEHIQCTTCHDPHASFTLGGQLLRVKDRESLCTCCHGRKSRGRNENDKEQD